MAIRKSLEHIYITLFSNLFKRFVHIFQDYYVDLYNSSTYITAQGFVSAYECSFSYVMCLEYRIIVLRIIIISQ